MTPNQEGRRWTIGAILLFAVIIGGIQLAKAAEPTATMMVLNQNDKSLKGVLYWESMWECRYIRKQILDFLWATGSEGMYYITCTPQEDLD